MKNCLEILIELKGLNGISMMWRNSDGVDGAETENCVPGEGGSVTSGSKVMSLVKVKVTAKLVQVNKLTTSYFVRGAWGVLKISKRHTFFP